MEVRKPQAYTGNAPYIFISYAHKDKARVYPIIEGLQRRGMRVWYDEGIPGGVRYSKELANRVIKSEVVMAFISRSSLDSEYCTYEIDFAHDKKKGLIFVYLEDVSLPDEMAFMYGRLQAFRSSDFGSVDALIDKIAKTDSLRPCRDLSRQPAQKQNNPAPAHSSATRVMPVKSTPARKNGVSGKGKIIAIVAAAVVALALVLVLVIPRLGGNTDPTGGNLDGTGGTAAPLPDDPSKRYDIAMEHIRQGKYDDAYEILKELGDYSDAASQMKAIREDAFLQKIKEAQPGDIVYWGSYEQDAVTSNGKEDIAWVVLYDDNGRKLLLSQKSLDCQPYYPQQNPTSWKTSNLRQWLNDDFYWEAFNEAEQNALYLPVIATKNSEDTRDYVYVLTMEEANLYIDLFANDVPTEYAIRQGASKESYGWWLRDVNNGAYIMGIACMWNDKSMINTNVDATGIAVRPCIWVDARTEAELEEAYNEALRLFENKNYKKAMTAFEALGDYKDSADYYARMPKLILLKPYAEAQVGDEVRLGNYDWIVVEKQDGKILVVSKYSVGIDGFRTYGSEITWDFSYPREFLNGQFLNSTLQAGNEKTLILPTLVSTPANPEYGTAGGPDVTDKVFLLSYEEVMKYFPTAQDRMLTTEADQNTTVVWWTRTMGETLNKAVCVDVYGNIDFEGQNTHDFVFRCHFRPAMWISTAE